MVIIEIIVLPSQRNIRMSDIINILSTPSDGLFEELDEVLFTLLRDEESFSFPSKIITPFSSSKNLIAFIYIS